MRINLSIGNKDQVLALRESFLQELNNQFVHNSYHARDWADIHLIRIDNTVVGYGALCGSNNRSIRDTIFEYYLAPPFRKHSVDCFRELMRTTHAALVNVQTNDHHLAEICATFAKDVTEEAVLFEDSYETKMDKPDAHFRAIKADDIIFEHRSEPIGSYVLHVATEVVATGGFLLHYNLPYADLFMEVKESFRKQGFASFLLQELKRECYRSGRVPAARCNPSNIASKKSLLKAGMRECGKLLKGKL
jgi:RimJ/RimL family protein N-acetyltransferase